MESPGELLALARNAQDLRDMWQGRLLRYTHAMPINRVVLSVIAANWPTEQVLVLLKVVFPWFDGVTAPFICSNASISKRGYIVADVVLRDGEIIQKNTVIFETERALRDVFRRLADEMRFSDEERRQLFAAVRNWVTADRRLDPTMDRRDPDARRLVAH